MGGGLRPCLYVKGVQKFLSGFQQMPAARKWTEEEITEIKRLYCEEGLALVKVGEKFNASK